MTGQLRQPPRLTGDLSQDAQLILDYVWDFYQALDLETNLTARLDEINNGLITLAARLDRLEQSHSTIAALTPLIQAISNPPSQAQVAEIRDRVNELRTAAVLPDLQPFIDALTQE